MFPFCAFSCVNLFFFAEQAWQFDGFLINVFTKALRQVAARPGRVFPAGRVAIDGHPWSRYEAS